MEKQTGPFAIRALLTGLLVTSALLLGGPAAQAGEYETKHPLCDGSVPCHRTVVWNYGTGVIDRVEAKVDGVCKVTLNTGALVTVSTESLTLSDGTVTADGISRAWRFPVGCPIWIHLRQPRSWPTMDVIWTKKTTADADKQFNIDWSRLP